jgi:hypothetical protein
MKQEMIEGWSIHHGFPCSEMHIVHFARCGSINRVDFTQQHSISMLATDMVSRYPDDHSSVCTKGAGFGCLLFSWATSAS